MAVMYTARAARRSCCACARSLVFSLLLLTGCLGEPSLLESLRSPEALVPSGHAFRIVLMPDTQYYTFPENEHIFLAQTAWIAANADELAIELVIHLGDITEHNNRDQWGIASHAMATLDGVVPYSVLPGNHDGILEDGIVGTAMFNDYFPFERLTGLDGGHMGETSDNNYLLLSASGQDLLILSLAYGVPDEAIQWAHTVLAAHPMHQVIVATHAYLDRDGTHLDSSDPSGARHPRWNDGEAIWNKLIRRHPNIFLVVCGHIYGGALNARRGDAGNLVYEMLADYQGEANGGNGWLRILTFDPAQAMIGVRTYSPTLRQDRNHIDHSFTLHHPMAPLP